MDLLSIRGDVTFAGGSALGGAKNRGRVKSAHGPLSFAGCRGKSQVSQPGNAACPLWVKSTGPGFKLTSASHCGEIFGRAVVLRALLENKRADVLLCPGLGLAHKAMLVLGCLSSITISMPHHTWAMVT